MSVEGIEVFMKTLNITDEAKLKRELADKRYYLRVFRQDLKDQQEAINETLDAINAIKRIAYEEGIDIT